MDRNLQRTLLTLVLAALAASCAGRHSSPSRPAPQGEASVWVYLAPLREEAARLSFDVSRIVAVSQSGEEFPLTLTLRKVNGRKMRDERLLAFGALPRGSYAALQIVIEDAMLDSGQGTSALATPAGPARVDVPFDLRRGDAAVLSLEVPYDHAVTSGFRFDPGFSGSVARDSALGLIGLAACRGAGTISFFDKMTGRTFGVVPVGLYPSAIVMARVVPRAYVSVTGDSVIVAIGLQEKAILERLQLGAGDEPEEMALTPDGSTLLTANAGSGTVSFIDVPNLVETNRVRVGDRPHSVRIDPNGRRAFVFNSLSNTISVIDMAQRLVAATLATEPEPLRGEFGDSGDRLYVIHGMSPYLTILDPVALSQERVYVGYGATAIAVDPLSGRILLARSGTGELEVYEPTTLLPVDFIPVPGDVRYLAVDPQVNNLHVVLYGENRVLIQRLSSKRALAEVDVGADPSWVALVGER